MADETKHTNRLIDETSPYLQQHAHNPVDWYPWGDEAIMRAQAEQKPILLSIGYSACHWCHVMEHESFEDEETAAVMNELFVNIKVDREERPDVDSIYMQAVQMMTGSGGWPLTVFLKPNLVPFYGGTYFPPEPRHGLPSFKQVLVAVAETFASRPDAVDENSGRLLEALRQQVDYGRGEGEPSAEVFASAFERVRRQFDSTNGGFGHAPKFPPSMLCDFLLRHAVRTGDEDALHVVEFTLEKMAAGGIYDHLGGGFHRYSVDEHWLVPHFEKMLYDNALLARLYLNAYKATGKAGYRRVVEETLDYVLREMTSPEGAFYSTQDADSEGVEGKFFVWTPEEIEAVLGADDAKLFSAYYGVTKGGNFEGHTILNVERTAEEVAHSLGVAVERLNEALERGRKLLYDVRATRIWPGRDEKTLAAWNGLMLRAFAEAGAALGREDYVDAARRNAEFIFESMTRDGLLLRTWKAGEAKLNAYLEDYAYLIEGLVSLYEATFETRWIVEAKRLADTMIAEFWDAEHGAFYFTGSSHEELIRRTKELEDNATPSGNSSAAWGLVRLGELTGIADYREKAGATLRYVQGSLDRYGRAFGHMLCALDFYLSVPFEIAIVGDPELPATQSLREEVYRRFIPAHVVAGSREGDTDAALAVPFLVDKPLFGGEPTAYVCRSFTCRLPVTTVEALVAELDAKPGANA